MEDADLPSNYYITFAAILSTVFSLVLPWFLTQWSITKLAHLIIPADADFLITNYLPELRDAVSSVHTTLEEKKNIAGMFFGMIIKILYAFLWQEHFIPITNVYKHPFLVSLGGALLPDINSFSNGISGFAQTDSNVENSFGVYPGDTHCRHYSPHAIWHEESANGLLEIVFLTDAINGILLKKTSN